MTEKKKPGKFEELRRRAQSRRAERVNEYELFGVDDGFDPPLVVSRMSLDTMESASEIAAQNPIRSFKIILGEDNYRRIVDELGEDTDIETLAEVVSDVNEFFYGPGADDVPGGSPAS